jgi:hypothetical protein
VIKTVCVRVDVATTVTIAVAVSKYHRFRRARVGFFRLEAHTESATPIERGPFEKRIDFLRQRRWLLTTRCN